MIVFCQAVLCFWVCLLKLAGWLWWGYRLHRDFFLGKQQTEADAPAQNQ